MTSSASAYDLMLVCDEPRAFYQAAHRAGLLRRNPPMLAMLDRVLPPTQVRLARDSWLVKASVVSMTALRRATSVRRKDQFLAGRLFQDVHVVWAINPVFAQGVKDAIESARRVTLDWVAPDLPERFDASVYVRQLFRTSFRFEVRPENRGRADALSNAQAARLVPIFAGVLEAMASEGEIARHQDSGYALGEPVSPARAFRRRVFLEWSRVRAVARWPKHAVTFDGWLDYIIKKAERHSGETIVLTPLERGLPFIFLWPRAFRFLLRQRGRGRWV